MRSSFASAAKIALHALGDPAAKQRIGIAWIDAQLGIVVGDRRLVMLQLQVCKSTRRQGVGIVDMCRTCATSF